MIGEREFEAARQLFAEGWSGDDPTAPLKWMTEDVVMRDIAGEPKPMRGHQAILEYWLPFAGKLKVSPEEMFASGEAVALSWMAYVKVDDGEHAGKYVCGEGMSRLEFRDGKVCLEVDYWHGPQGVCDDWEAHFQARQRMGRAARGVISGA